MNLHNDNPKLAIVRDSKSQTKVQHFGGLPPKNGLEPVTRKKLGMAAFVLMEKHDDGIFLIRFDHNGNCVGDTWHKNSGDALYQAKFEYDLEADDWVSIPVECEDSIVFGIKSLKKRGE